MPTMPHGPFSEIRQSIQAFADKDERSGGPAAKTAEEIELLADPKGALGFRKRLVANGDKATLVANTRKLLNEQGRPKSSEEVEQGIDYLERKEKMAQARMRFIVQAIISVIVLVAAITMVFLKSTSPAAEKAAFGLIGTVIGYWLH
jgi:hypothetical protein